MFDRTLAYEINLTKLPVVDGYSNKTQKLKKANGLLGRDYE